MKTEVTLLVRGRKLYRTINTLNPSNAGAVAMQRLHPSIDRLRDVRILQCIGHCGFKPASHGNLPPKHT